MKRIIVFLLATIGLSGLSGGPAGAIPTFTTPTFMQVGGPPPTDVKVTYGITDLAQDSYAMLATMPLKFTFSAFEDDIFGNDLLGSWMVTLRQGDVTQLSGGGYRVLGLMHTLAGGVAAGGGASDNEYFLRLDSVAKISAPASLLLLLSALAGAAGLRRRPARLRPAGGCGGKGRRLARRGGRCPGPRYRGRRGVGATACPSPAPGCFDPRPARGMIGTEACAMR